MGACFVADGVRRARVKQTAVAHFARPAGEGSAWCSSYRRQHESCGVLPTISAASGPFPIPPAGMGSLGRRACLAVDM
eukprot:scaffold155332_cov34-Tisochrysis_lutea.AAC.3